MHVAFTVFGNIVVEDHVEVLDVQAARGDVGCHKQLDLPCLDAFDYPKPLPLGKVAHDEGAVVPVHLEPSGDLFSRSLCICEYNCGIRLVSVQEAEEKPELLLPAHVVENLRNTLDCYLLGVDFDLRWIVHMLPCDIAGASAERCAEEHRNTLFARRHLPQYPADIRIEPHVEEPVRLVDDHNAGLPEVELPGLAEIDQSARCSDHDVDAFGNALLLNGIAYSAVKAPDTQRNVSSEQLRLRFYLNRQFPGRCYDDGDTVF